MSKINDQIPDPKITTVGVGDDWVWSSTAASRDSDELDLRANYFCRFFTFLLVALYIELLIVF